jgi:MSHA biogenesis protein MshJ
MKDLFKRYAARIDGASLRERFMIFGAAALLLLVTLYSALIEPRLGEQRRLSARLITNEAESTKLQAQMQKLVLARPVNPDVEARKRLAVLRTEIETLNEAIAREHKKFTPPERITAVLEELLARNRRLRLMEMKTLPVATLSEVRGTEASAKPGATPGSNAAPAPGPASDRLIYRHGLEITLSGTYLDMLTYLSEVEKLPTQLYWGSLELTVVEYPVATLKLTVYTVSLDRAWMIV